MPIYRFLEILASIKKISDSVQSFGTPEEGGPEALTQSRQSDKGRLRPQRRRGVRNLFVLSRGANLINRSTYLSMVELPMRRSTIAGLTFLTWVFVGLSPARAAAYTATLLHPAGFSKSEGRGISGDSQVGGASPLATPNLSHALLWNGTAESFVDLHPEGFTASFAMGASGSNQVGYGSSESFYRHALLWSGTADSFVDLHPPIFWASEARAVSGDSQVGVQRLPSWRPAERALLWKGTAESYVDLHPAGFDYSAAEGVSGDSQVGYGESAGRVHALLWNGTAESCIDLHPTGFRSSVAKGVSGITQVGHGVILRSIQPHALSWNGTAESYVDLHPAGFLSSFALGVSGNRQVGYGKETTTSQDHALAWSGTAASYVDLHQYLTSLSPAFISSKAYGIDANGDVVGVASDGSANFAVKWSLSVVPEPASILLFAIGGASSLLIGLRQRN